MVNLLGEKRPTAAPIELDRELPPPLRAALPARLHDVQRWWTGLPADASTARRARTPALEPDLEEESSLPALDAALMALAERRAELLSRRPSRGSPRRSSRALQAASPRSPVAPVAESGRSTIGRLLVCEMDMSIGGGEAEAASRGLLDLDDRPPWDLWLVAWGRTHGSRPEEPLVALVAWIPPEWQALAQAGIEACPTRSLCWAG